MKGKFVCVQCGKEKHSVLSAGNKTCQKCANENRTKPPVDRLKYIPKQESEDDEEDDEGDRKKYYPESEDDMLMR